MSFDAKEEILKAIADTGDKTLKTILLLLLGVLEELGTKIDAMGSDERALREVVLNGHEEVHHGHHEWVAKKIKQEEDDEKNAAASKRKIRDGLIEKILWLVLVALAGSGWWLK